MFDFGTGARYFGLAQPKGVPFRCNVLLSHMHWDHIQGFPFFPPMLRAGTEITIHSPPPEGYDGMESFVRTILNPPAFPVGLDVFAAEVSFVEHLDETFAIGDAVVTSRQVPHLGVTLGYRVEIAGRSIVYISDHQQPGVDTYTLDDKVRELCTGADLLIHDAQYTRAEFAQKSDWGHCTADYARWVADDCQVDTFAMFHHDPGRTDDQLDALTEAIIERATYTNVVTAREGLTLSFDPR